MLQVPALAHEANARKHQLHLPALPAFRVLDGSSLRLGVAAREAEHAPHLPHAARALTTVLLLMVSENRSSGRGSLTLPMVWSLRRRCERGSAGSVHAITAPEPAPNQPHIVRAH